MSLTEFTWDTGVRVAEVTCRRLYYETVDPEGGVTEWHALRGDLVELSTTEFERFLDWGDVRPSRVLGSSVRRSGGRALVEAHFGPEAA
jgi:hypothetical protein